MYIISTGIIVYFKILSFRWFWCNYFFKKFEILVASVTLQYKLAILHKTESYLNILYGTDLSKVNFRGRIPVFVRGRSFTQVESEENDFTF